VTNNEIAGLIIVMLIWIYTINRRLLRVEDRLFPKQDESNQRKQP